MGVWLDDDDNGVIPRFDLVRANQVIVQKLDPGFPAIREVTDPYVDASGVIDSTAYHDARLVTLTGMIIAGALPRSEIADRILAHFVPGQRSFLHWQLNDDLEARCVQFRASRASRPVERHNRVMFNLALAVPKGVIESSELQVKSINPSTSGGTESGRSYDLSFDRTYPASDPLGSSSVVNEGSVTAWPIITIQGACTNPSIENVTTGEQFDFPALTLTSGESLIIDTVQRTIETAAGVSKLADLDLTNSEWWGLRPGENILAFQPDTATGATCTVRYRHAHL